MKTVYYKIKRDKGEITVIFWLADNPKDVRKEQFIVVEPDRLKFRFKNAFKLDRPFEMEELVD